MIYVRFWIYSIRNNKLYFEKFQHLQCPPNFNLIQCKYLCFLLCVQGYHNEIEQISNYENQYQMNIPIQFNNGIKIESQKSIIHIFQYKIQYIKHEQFILQRKIEIYIMMLTQLLKTNMQTQVLAIKQRKRANYDQIQIKKKQKYFDKSERINYFQSINK
ncbi:unnamed protein product [Paramecium pentaurelia]|uniref:Uncharacterized protein n=1 Tax=Paramecium pentaurelia TaxID=43138 RepID=A0A8S1U1R5_9CILI|nr:unnamed protein product [Paramecium pentaurelia]